MCGMVKADTETTGDDDAWASPKFFLDIKKGDSEDRALLFWPKPNHNHNWRTTHCCFATSSWG